MFLGAAMVSMGVASYLGAQDTASSVIQARGSDFAFSARRALFLAGEATDELLEGFLDDAAEQGLRFIGVADRSGDFLASAGSASPSTRSQNWTSCCPGPGPVVELFASKVMVVQSLMPEHARGKGRRGFGMGRMGRLRNWRDRLLVIEFEPVVAASITNRANITLVISLLAALVLMATAATFWRLSVRADRYAVQLQKDEQLKMLGEMSAVLGHEIRNPLASLKGHAQLLVEKLTGHSAEKGAQRVVREAVRLEELSNHVLDFARTGEMSLKAEDPMELARAAAVAIGPDRVRIQSSNVPTTWRLDRLRMEQVLVNLLRNALQASKDGAQVELEVTHRSDRLVFDVRDHGEGIEPGQEQQLFTPFFTGRVKGTGLGLTLAKRIVTGHAGKITAYNHPEGGAVFRVELSENEGEG